MKRLAVAVAMTLTLALAGCSSTPPPVEESPVVTGKQPEQKPARPESHIVARGETLYSIAFSYGLDYQQLAVLNGIREPFTIYPGQKLRLSKVTPAVVKKPVTPVAKPAASQTPAGVGPNGMGQGRGWLWPVKGRVLSRFNAESVGPKGIALAGSNGDTVHAARGGRVVYTGNSLVGYGQLVIIKHDDIYLSAYAHNSKLLVKEGEQVGAGQAIAEMGSSGTDRTQLHFEVRRNGDPIDPLQVLPRR